MKTIRQTSTLSRRSINTFVATMLLLICSLATEVHAQSFSIRVDPVTLGPSNPDRVVNDVAEVTQPVLATMNSSAWRTLRKEHVRALSSPDVDERGQAIQNILYLQRFYPQQSKVRRMSNDLYGIYRFDRDERLRIMAIHALHAIGKENTMRQLAQEVHLEASPRVRKTMIAAVNDYFGKQPR